MPRSYRHISDYEIEIIEKFNNGQSLKSIAEEYGFSYKQIRNFKYRYNSNQRKINAGQAIHKKVEHAKILMVICRHQFKDWISLHK